MDSRQATTSKKSEPPIENGGQSNLHEDLRQESVTMALHMAENPTDTTRSGGEPSLPTTTSATRSLFDIILTDIPVHGRAAWHVWEERRGGATLLRETDYRVEVGRWTRAGKTGKVANIQIDIEN